MLIYIMIVGVALSAAVTFSFEFLATRAKAAAFLEAERNARLALSRMAIEVRESSGVNVGDSVFGSNPGRLSLVLADAGKNPTVFSVSGGTLYVQQGAGPNLPLTSPKVVVSDLTIDNLSPSNKYRALRLRINVDSSSDYEIYQASAAVETTARVKRGDGFSD